MQHGVSHQAIQFSAAPLPNLAQIAPIKAIVAQDVDGDGNLDLIVAGNMYDAEPNIPRADAGNGLWLRGDGKGHFAPVPTWRSGLVAPSDVTGLATLHTVHGRSLIVGNSRNSFQAFTITKH